MARRNFRNPRTRYKILRTNFSSRSHPVHGSKVLALAIHSTESHERPGDSDVGAIWNWFNNPSAQASSHYLLDADANIWNIVPDRMKAWTIGEANSFTINYELIGFAALSNREWRKRVKLLKSLAKLLAYHSRRYGIPLRHGKVENRGGVAVCTRSGVIMHRDVTRAGFGTHTDPGPHFPFRLVLTMAKWYKRFGWT